MAAAAAASAFHLFAVLKRAKKVRSANEARAEALKDHVKQLERVWTAETEYEEKY